MNCCEIIVLTVTLPFFSVSAADKESSQPTLAFAGSVLYENRFTQLPSEWRGHGQQTIADGAWQIAENPAEHHAAAPKMKSPAQNLVAEFEWRVPSAKSVAFRFDVKTGHLCNVSWAPGADGKPGRVVLAMQDYDRDAGPAKPMWLDSKPFSTSRDQWVKVHWEMVGDEILVYVGNVRLYGKNEAIKLPKTTVAFPVGGGAAQIRNLKIFEARQNPDWPKQRAQ